MSPPAGPDRPVLLTGASGLLGHWMLATRPSHLPVVALTHRRPVAGFPLVQADLRDAEATAAAIRLAAPSLIVHAAYAKDRESIVDATRHVADAAADVGADVLLVSTDAVFAGDGVERDETSQPDPVWDYGRWKASAERIALGRAPAASVVRLPLLVSVDPDDHVVRAVRQAAADGHRVPWFTDELRRPAFAHEVAAAIWRIASLAADRRRGTWHLAGPERLSRHEIALRVVDTLGLDRDAVEGTTTPAGAARPRDLDVTDHRARVGVAWDPTPVFARS